MPVNKTLSNKNPKPASRAGVNGAAKESVTLTTTNAMRNNVAQHADKALQKSSATKTALKLDGMLPPVKSSPVSMAAKSLLKKGASANKADKQSQEKAKAAKNLKASINGKGLPAADIGLKDLPKVSPQLKESLAKKPAGSAKSSMRIFQIYYENWQRDLLDPNFSGLDNSKATSEMLEFAVFDQLSKSEQTKDAALWGALSWRFSEKTGMSGTDWVKSIEAHPGQDVYFCNPFPHNEALFHNLWFQGETSHPQFYALSQAVFKAAGLPLEELTSIHSSEQFSAANYFVGTPKFWAAYLPWVNNVLSQANKKLPPNARDLLHSKQADERGIHHGATYVPFIVERLFPVFMKTAGKNLKSYKIALPERERELNVHLKLLREMKDVAHRTKSAWLAVCWANYRNLYLTQVSGKEWAKKYLPVITPTEVKFS